MFKNKKLVARRNFHLWVNLLVKDWKTGIFITPPVGAPFVCFLNANENYKIRKAYLKEGYHARRRHWVSDFKNTKQLVFEFSKTPNNYFFLACFFVQLAKKWSSSTSIYFSPRIFFSKFFFELFIQKGSWLFLKKLNKKILLNL